MCRKLFLFPWHGWKKTLWKCIRQFGQGTEYFCAICGFKHTVKTQLSQRKHVPTHFLPISIDCQVKKTTTQMPIHQTFLFSLHFHEWTGTAQRLSLQITSHNRIYQTKQPDLHVAKTQSVAASVSGWPAAPAGHPSWCLGHTPASPVHGHNNPVC